MPVVYLISMQIIRLIKSRLVILLAMLLLVLPVIGAGAQPNDDSRRIVMLQSELEQTDDLIARASNKARTSSNPISQKLAAQAGELQKEAWVSFSLRTESGFRLARQFTAQAHETAQSSLGNSPKGERLDDFVLRRLERIQELVDRTEAEIGQDSAHGRFELYQSARSDLERAWVLYRNHEFRPALRLSEQAERACEKVLRGENNRVSEKRQFEHLSQRVQGAIDQTRRSASDCIDSQETLELLEEAGRAHEKARERSANGRPLLALRELHRSRELAGMAEQACHGSEGLLKYYDKLRAEAKILASRINEKRGPRKDKTAKFLRQGLDQLDLAKGFIDNHRPKAAAAALRAAQLSLRQVEHHGKGGIRR